MTVGDSNLLSREDVIELQKLTADLRGKSDNADPTMSIRVGVLDLVMLLKDLVHLRRQVTHLQAMGTKHVLSRQGEAPGWNYTHQLMNETPTADAVSAAAILLGHVLEEPIGAKPDGVGFGLRVWPSRMGGWVANVIWRTE